METGVDGPVAGNLYVVIPLILRVVRTLPIAKSAQLREGGQGNLTNSLDLVVPFHPRLVVVGVDGSSLFNSDIVYPPL